MDNDEVTGLLREIRGGNKAAVDKLLPLLYPELHQMAVNYFRRERPDHTLQPTALVHEAYLRLVTQHAVDWGDKLQFLGLAAILMRRALVNYARGRHAAKRGRDAATVSLEDASAAFNQLTEEMLAIDEALDRLAVLDAEQARIVELHFFGGLTFEDIADLTGVSVRTVKRRWQLAKAWLFSQIAPPGATSAAAP